ncbi:MULTISPECIES: hypothetical protein [Listeria]|uniref:hypothetical protein n=1 Tax=Listeria TaxID=1637 RepID=UPI000B592D93|nr:MULTISPECIES: hypothetical protein [Listeria]
MKIYAIKEKYLGWRNRVGRKPNFYRETWFEGVIGYYEFFFVIDFRGKSYLKEIYNDTVHHKTSIDYYELSLSMQETQHNMYLESHVESEWKIVDYTFHCHKIHYNYEQKTEMLERGILIEY